MARWAPWTVIDGNDKKAARIAALTTAEVALLQFFLGLQQLLAQSGLLDRAAMERWRAAYDAASISANSSPPRALVELVASADLAVASCT